MFLSRLEEGVARSQSWLCVGLDPRAGEIPASFGGTARGMLRHLKRLVDSTEPRAAAYKANLAFYLSWGPPGLRVLSRIVEYIHASAGCPVILDGKWGDIASTAAAYAAAAERLGVDAVTSSVYMGQDAVTPLLEKGLFVFVLALPSNPASRGVVDHGEPPLYLEVTSLAVEMERQYPGLVGLVVGATRSAAAGRVYQAAPHLPWLVPGVGTQGGDLARILGAAPGHLVLVNVSRAVAGAADPAASAHELADRIQSAKETG
ncbi:MAG: orotidine-5'-phosphate decarboxylase [Candidatus Bipolaricaulota bacterium]